VPLDPNRSALSFSMLTSVRRTLGETSGFRSAEKYKSRSPKSQGFVRRNPQRVGKDQALPMTWVGRTQESEVRGQAGLSMLGLGMRRASGVVRGEQGKHRSRYVKPVEDL
jgi:hypothetical protein